MLCEFQWLLTIIHLGILHFLLVLGLLSALITDKDYGWPMLHEICNGLVNVLMEMAVCYSNAPTIT